MDKSSAASVLNVDPDRVDAAQPPDVSNSPDVSADAFGHPRDEKGAHDLTDKFEKKIEYLHHKIVALNSGFEKAGKLGYSTRMAAEPSFPAFSETKFWGMLSARLRQANVLSA